MASSIPNLSASRVTVVDQDGQLLNEGGGETLFSDTDRFFDYKQMLEQQYAQKIQDILMPILGIGRVKAKVSADIDFTSYEQTQEMFNPELPSLRSEQSMEERRASASGGGPGGVPGTLSNLPQPNSAGTGPARPSTQVTSSQGAAAGQADSRDMRTQSTKNFELDKTISHTKNQPGTIKRLSVAVLIDNKSTMDPKTKKLVTKPLTPKEIEQIKLLVADAIGLNPKRGDSLNVMNSDFVKPEPIAPLPEEKWWQQEMVWSIGKQVAGALFVLIMIFGVLRPMLKTLASNKNMVIGEAAGGSSGGQGGGGPGGAMMDAGGSYNPEAVMAAATDYDSQVNALRQVVEKEPKRVAQVVKSWVDRGNMDGIERAAILLLSMGEKNASEVLKHLEPRQVQKVGMAMATMTSVSKVKTQAVMTDFISAIKDQTSLTVDTESYLRTVLIEALGEEKAIPFIDRILVSDKDSGLNRLKWLDGRLIADVIRNEHPQIIATILIHLDSEQAAEVVSFFSAEKRAEVLLRMCNIETVKPEAISELGKVIENQLSGQTVGKTASIGGIKSVADVINFLDGRWKRMSWRKLRIGMRSWAIKFGITCLSLRILLIWMIVACKPCCVMSLQNN